MDVKYTKEGENAQRVVQETGWLAQENLGLDKPRGSGPNPAEVRRG